MSLRFGVEKAKDAKGNIIPNLYRGAVYFRDHGEGGDVPGLHAISDKRLPYGEAFVDAQKLYYAHA